MNHLRGGIGPVDLGKDGGKLVKADLRHDVRHLTGGGLAAGFLLHGAEDGQVEGVGEIGKSVVEGDKFPTGEGFQGGLHQVIGLGELFPCQPRVGGIQSRVVRVQLGQAAGQILQHGAGPQRVHPNVGVRLMLMAGREDSPFVMVSCVLPLQQRDALGAVNLGRIAHSLQGAFHGLLQAGAVAHDDVGPFQGLHIFYGEGVVMQAADGLVDHQGDGAVRNAAGHLAGEEIHRVGGGDDLGPAVFCSVAGVGGAGGQQQKEATQKEQAGSSHRLPPFIRYRMVIHYTPGRQVCKRKSRKKARKF